MTGSRAEWCEDLDALQFATGDNRVCMVHRLAFRRLLGRGPHRDECLGYFAAHVQAFTTAAARKVEQRGIAAGRNFHLTSRDIARQYQEATARNLRGRG
jgi:hypothetical protein